jgi:Transposase DDE domain
MTSTFDLEVCRRLPLADAALRLLDFATDDHFLTDLFARHRGRSYEGVIRFPLLVHLMAEALLGHRGSAHQTFRQAQEEGTLTATVEAMYGKLKRVPVGLSQAFFAETTARLASVLPVRPSPLPASLADFRVLNFDGKKVKHVAKRLKPLRGLKGAVLGGKLLVVQDVGTGQALVVEATADGEAADNPLVPGAVAQVRARPDGSARLWVGDRAFCDFQTLPVLAQAADHFLVRYHAKCHFVPDPDTPARTGTDANGRTFREEWGWLGKPTNQQRLYVRRITLTRPNDEALIVVTTLLDADRYPAADVLTAYRRRWGIEGMFLRVTQTFGLRHLIGATPQATVFQAAFCLLLYNITLAVQGYVAAGAQRAPETISLHLLFEELTRDLTAWFEVLGPTRTADVLAGRVFRGPDDFRRYLTETLGGLWTDRWTKAPTRKRPPKGPPRAYLRGGHSSVERIRRGAHQEIPIVPRKRPAATPENA